MRDIKFRGKGLKSNEIVYGDLIHGVGCENGNVFVLPSKVNLAYVKNCDPLNGVKVDPETVGQFTGLTDKNGKEIYEGDILKDGKGSNGTVVFASPQFVVQVALEIYSLAEGKVNVAQLEYTEVIGNIHDNPELLKQ